MTRNGLRKEMRSAGLLHSEYQYSPCNTPE